jgi:hypothetical protein
MTGNRAGLDEIVVIHDCFPSSWAGFPGGITNHVRGKADRGREQMTPSARTYGRGQITHLLAVGR